MKIPSLQLAMCVALMDWGGAGASEVRYRKNIDDLSPAELAAYKHAVKMMKQKSQQNIFDRSGHIWQAWVHNCTQVDVFDARQASLSAAGLKRALSNPGQDSCQILNLIKVPNGTLTHPENPGNCEHQKNTFLQWHRAQLYFYEQALQAADPEGRYGPSTSKVALPYWNFTRLPSGRRFPRAFEDIDSPLYDSTRYKDALPSSLPTSSPYLLAYQIYYMDWPSFGGDEIGTRSGGGLETKIHNRMHARYIGGNMADNVTAGLDPIFYVFHNFLDYAFDKWLDGNGQQGVTGSGRSLFMRAEQDAALPKPAGFTASAAERADSRPYTKDMGRAEIYFDTIAQGYGFQPRAGGEFIPRADIQALIDAHQGAGFVFGDQTSLFSALLKQGDGGAAARPQVKRSSAYVIPGKAVDKPFRAALQFARKGTATDYSFQADVYLYPQGVAEQIADQGFRDRYLVSNTSHWALSGHAHGEIRIAEDIGAIVNSLSAGKAGQGWVLTVAVSVADKDSGSVRDEDFSLPAIVVTP